MTQPEVKLYPLKGDPVNGIEKRMLELMQGAKPENDFDRQLLEEINKAKAEGKEIEIPFN